MRAARFIGACVLAAVVYGVAHDMVTARVCIEYFTVGHPKLIASTDPTQLALFWGVVATAWVGLALGIALVVTASVGLRPAFPLQNLFKKVLGLLLVMGLSASIAGILGWVLARNGTVVLVPSLADAVPSDHHIRFIAVGWAHGASYLIGIGGGLFLVFQVWRIRGLEMIRLMREKRRASTSA